MDKDKLLSWIDMRITEHKEKVNKIYQRYENDHPQHFVGNDRKEYDFHNGAMSELVFLRKCVSEFN